MVPQGAVGSRQVVGMIHFPVAREGAPCLRCDCSHPLPLAVCELEARSRSLGREAQLHFLRERGVLAGVPREDDAVRRLPMQDRSHVDSSPPLIRS